MTDFLNLKQGSLDIGLGSEQNVLNFLETLPEATIMTLHNKYTHVKHAAGWFNVEHSEYSSEEALAYSIVYTDYYDSHVFWRIVYPHGDVSTLRYLG